jgi:hypothetical protein
MPCPGRGHLIINILHKRTVLQPNQEVLVLLPEAPVWLFVVVLPVSRLYRSICWVRTGQFALPQSEKV